MGINELGGVNLIAGQKQVTDVHIGDVGSFGGYVSQPAVQAGRASGHPVGSY